VAILTKTQDEFVADLAAAWAANTGITATLRTGSPVLAIFQAVAAQATWLLAQIQAVNAFARASTSVGSDLDSWMADFKFARLPAVAATGQVTFSAISAHSSPVVVPVGTVVQTPGGAIQYQVIADTTQTAYSAAQNAYVLQAGQTSMTATAQALVTGTASNVQANQLTQIVGVIPGVDLVTNAAAIANGVDAEPDAAFRARFVAYLSSLSQATAEAITYAVTSLQQGLDINLVENQTPAGQAKPGSFFAVVDDGTGNPPSSLLANALAAVNATRAFTVEPSVIGPTTVPVTVAITVRIAAGYATGTVEQAVQTAVAAAVNATPIGGTVYISAVVEAAMTTPGVVAVQSGSVTLNGTAADLVATSVQVLRTTTSQVTVATY
jgi:uncharacterized phage protein gp47/JayE